MADQEYRCTTRKPCDVGDSLDDVDTPALIVCLDTLEANLDKLPNLMKSFPAVAFRPHSKVHKCPAIARLQVASGAVGVCCQTVTEAEVMADGGIDDIFITNEVVEAKKLHRLPAIAKKARLSLCVDHPENVDLINTITKQHDMVLDLVIEISCGGNRCGVQPGIEVVLLAKKIQSLTNVRFKGLHCYHGVSQHTYEYNKRYACVQKAVQIASDAVKALKENGIECTYVTGGGTGTFEMDSASGVYTEIQSGSYVMMDVDYHKLKDKSGNHLSDFKSSLYVLGTVISVQENCVVLNAGMKAVSPDSGPPAVKDKKDSIVITESDEHSLVLPRDDFKLGQKVMLIPGHCDPTVNLHEWIVGVRNGKVETMWPVSGRGWSAARD